MATSDILYRFSQIYGTHQWGGVSRSGPGSDPAVTGNYRAIVESVLKSQKIQTVVDVGCGDWASSQFIDWGNCHYTGVDLVPELIETLKSQYDGARRRFITGNLISDTLPSADLCIVKDVLQHLSNASVLNFIRSQLPRFKLALITNDARKSVRTPSLLRPWRRVEIGQPNSEIENGGSRPLRLTEAPFMLSARRMATMMVSHEAVLFEKEVLLWKSSYGVR